MSSRYTLSRRMLLAAAAACALPSPLPAQTSVDLNPDLAELFHEAGTEGCFAALQLSIDRLVMTDETRARRGYRPGTTFMIPAALAALDIGVVADVDEVIRWDGVPREFDEWNQDHTLRSAMRHAVLPVLQQITERIGAERMKHYLEAFRYGSRAVGPTIDRFWFDGELRISALEQVHFLARLHRNDLPVAKRNLEAVKEVLPADETARARIRYVLGTLGADGTQGKKPTLGWLVGYAEAGEAVTPFAMNLDVHGEPDLARRLPITRHILTKLGAA
jgi:beta-lactamase class D